MSHKSLVAWILALLLLPTTAFAEEPLDGPDEPDFTRPGFYVGLGFAYGFGEFYEDVIEDEAGLMANVTNTEGLTARAGYRFASWFALEAHYEWMDDFEVQVAGFDLLEQSTHTLTGNLKFIVPTWRIQPYLMLGVGAQYYDLDGPVGTLVDANDWLFAGRPAVGIDFYLTENLVLNVEAAGTIAVSDFSGQLASLDTAPYVSVGGGLQWRF